MSKRGGPVWEYMVQHSLRDDQHLAELQEVNFLRRRPLRDGACFSCATCLKSTYVCLPSCSRGCTSELLRFAVRTASACGMWNLLQKSTQETCGWMCSGIPL